MQPFYPSTKKSTEFHHRGPLHQWSDEDVLSWDDWYVKNIGVGEVNA